MAPGKTMKPALLFLSAHLPGPNAPPAGHKTAFRTPLWLAEAFQIYLLSFASESDGELAWGELRRHCTSIELVNGTTAVATSSWRHDSGCPCSLLRADGAGWRHGRVGWLT